MVSASGVQFRISSPGVPCMLAAYTATTIGAEIVAAIINISPINNNDSDRGSRGDVPVNRSCICRSRTVFSYSCRCIAN